MANYEPNGDARQQNSMAAGMQWVHRITTVVLEMLLPGLIGLWLDKKWETNFLGLVGFGLGLFTGISHLIQMTKHDTASKNSAKSVVGDDDVRTPSTDSTTDK